MLDCFGLYCSIYVPITAAVCVVFTSGRRAVASGTEHMSWLLHEIISQPPSGAWLHNNKTAVKGDLIDSQAVLTCSIGRTWISATVLSAIFFHFATHYSCKSKLFTAPTATFSWQCSSLSPQKVPDDASLIFTIQCHQRFQLTTDSHRDDYETELCHAVFFYVEGIRRERKNSWREIKDTKIRAVAGKKRESHNVLVFMVLHQAEERHLNMERVDWLVGI